jgi:hypothetical protein
MKYYCTKFWKLTKKIILFDTPADFVEKRVRVFNPKPYGLQCGTFVMDLHEDCFLTLEEAQNQIQAELKSEVQKAQNKLDKLEALQTTEFQVLLPPSNEQIWDPEYWGS